MVSMNGTGEPSQERTQHCKCGNDTYHIKWTFEGEIWAECSECGRPTASVGDGIEIGPKWRKKWRQADEQ